MFGNPETTPGGRALKFYSSVRLEVRRAEQLKQGNDVMGNKTRIKVVKTKSLLRSVRLKWTLCTVKESPKKGNHRPWN